MDFIIGSFLRLLILSVCIAVEIIVVMNIIKHFSFKKVILLLIPFMTVFTMFFQGIYIKPKIDIENAINIAQNIASSDENKNSCGVYDNGDYHIILSSYESDDAYKELDDISDKNKGICKAFLIKCSDDGINYYISPMRSDRQAEGFYMHQGYKGTVIVAVKKDLIVEFDYSVYRKSDELFGWLFAPPVTERIDFSRTINLKNLKSREVLM